MTWTEEAALNRLLKVAKDAPTPTDAAERFGYRDDPDVQFYAAAYEAVPQLIAEISRLRYLLIAQPRGVFRVGCRNFDCTGAPPCMLCQWEIK